MCRASTARPCPQTGLEPERKNLDFKLGNRSNAESFIATAAGYVLCRCTEVHYERNANREDPFAVPRSITVSLQNKLGKVVKMKRPLTSFSLLEIADSDQGEAEGQNAL